MTKRLLCILLALAVCVCAFGQNETGAIITRHDECFQMTSPTSGTHSVHTCIKVLDEAGLSAAGLFLVTDSFRSLSDFRGELVQPGDKKTKLSKKDLYTYSLSTGLADDSYATVYKPGGKYPFTVEYEYSISYKGGIHTFPTFYPVPGTRTEVINATFTLEVPIGTIIKHREGNVKASELVTTKKFDTYKWESGHVAAIVPEHNMPPASEYLPYVYSTPVSFVFANTSGRQEDWNSLGSWLFSLQKDCDDLSEEEIARVREMVADCSSTFDKVRVLYKYLKDRTRYVSVQLGIGGLQPEPASKVSASGFGDCKGLSNYMRSLLRAVGVESKYYTINTRVKDLWDEYASLGQMNHAMLAVPLPENGDTLFVECTNPSYPLGYRHSDCAGHDILIVDSNGGTFTSVGDYPDSLNRVERNTVIQLAADGSAHINTEGVFVLDDAEPFIFWGELKPEKQRALLISGWKLQPDNLQIKSIKNNFEDYPLFGREFYPKVSASFSMDCTVYANKNAGRLFIPINPLARQLYAQRSPRISDLYYSRGQIIFDHYTIRLPDNYIIENLPESTTIASEWGELSSAVVEEPDGSISVTQTFKGYPSRTDKSRYPAFKEFTKSVNKAYSANIVIVAK